MNPFITNTSSPPHPAHTTHDAHLLCIQAVIIWFVLGSSVWSPAPSWFVLTLTWYQKRAGATDPRAPSTVDVGVSACYASPLLLLDVGVCHYRYHCINSLHLPSHLYFLANIFLKLSKTLSLFAVWTCAIFVHFWGSCCCCFIRNMLMCWIVCVRSIACKAIWTWRHHVTGIILPAREEDMFE